MNALALIVPDFASRSGSGSSIRIVPIIGSYMEPTARSGDIAVVVDADCYRYEGLYELAFFPGVSEIRRCQRIGNGVIRAKSDGKHCVGAEFSISEFNRAVVGQVVAIARVLDRPLLMAAQRGGAVHECH
nr:hypothetical protein [uncultured Roseococcus sp.]